MDLTVADVMTRDVTTLGPELSLTQMDHILLSAKIGAAPVIEDGHLIGIASRSDVIRLLAGEQSRAERISGFYSSPFPIGLDALEHLARDSRVIADRMTKTRVRDIMTRDIEYLSPEDNVEAAARFMWGEGFHHVPVVSNGRLMGILSAMDLVRLIGERGLSKS